MICVLRRRLSGSKKPKSIADLLNDATMVYRYSVNNSPAAYMRGSPSLANGTYYLFSVCYGYMNIYKINQAFSATLVKNMNTGNGYCLFNNGSYSVVYSGNSSSSSATSVYGGTLMIVNFPTYVGMESDIDTLLQGATYTRITGYNATSQTTVSTTDKNHAYYLTTKRTTMGSGANYTGFDFWSCNGTSYTLLKQVSSDGKAGTNNNGTLTLGSIFGGSIIAID